MSPKKKRIPKRIPRMRIPMAPPEKTLPDRRKEAERAACRKPVKAERGENGS
ncbi:MAG: hypothetical protein NTW86_29435 [Candidatus Sumerlaeota bacterium]|nr:hypothetical protein [Candidatus Sumerlaeota bacterium]